MRRPFIVMRTGLLSLATILSPQSASAAWPTDPSVNVPLCTVAGNQIRPRIVTDGAGGAIVTWHDRRNGLSGIFAQRLLASGEVDPAWPVNGRDLCTAENSRSRPSIVSDGAGGAIVTWSDSRNDPASDIYAQHVLPGGSIDPNWAEDGIALCTLVSPQDSPTIVGDGAGGAIVTWVDSRSPFNADIYTQRVLAAGIVDPTWPNDGQALCTATGHQFFPLIVTDGAGGAIVAWQDNRHSSGACGCGIPDVFAQHVQASGTVDPNWSFNGLGLCTVDSSQYSTAIISDGAGGAIVTWADQRSGNFDVYAQHVLANGATDLAWPTNGRALCTAANEQWPSAMTADGNGGAIVAWYDYRDGDYDIYAQHVLADGTVDPAWPSDGRILCAAAGNQQTPDIVSDGLGGAIVGWTDFRGSNLDIYAQRVLASGALDPRWPVDGQALCTAPSHQYTISMLSDGAGGAIAVWEDTRTGPDLLDIYAQRVQANGELGGEVVGIVSPGRLSLSLDPRPNPSRGGRLVVNFTLESDASATLDLFDVAGRRVASHELGSLGAGPHSLHLGAELRLTPGIYFLRLKQGLNVHVARVAITD